MGEGAVYLSGQGAADPRLTDIGFVDDVAEEAGDTDGEHEQRHHEEEEPEGEGAAHHRARHLLIAVVEHESHLDDRAPPVPFQQLVEPGLACGEPAVATDQAFDAGDRQRFLGWPFALECRVVSEWRIGFDCAVVLGGHTVPQRARRSSPGGGE